MINRGIDHVVLCTRDLERARARYAAMGFTVTPKAVHPFGTGNSLVQLDGCFLELLAVHDPDRIAEATDDTFSFAAFNRDFLEEDEGFSMLVFESRDAAADRREFMEKGLSRLAPFDFERQAELPDGSTVTVGFSLSFVTHPDMPRAAFFTCQQHAPQYFWKTEYMTHANTARTIAEVVMVASEPRRYETLFAALQGEEAVQGDGEALSVSTSRGLLSVLSPASWTDRYGALPHPDLGQGPRFAACSIAVADLDACSESLVQGGFAVEIRDGCLVVPPAQAFGVLIEFTGHAQRVKA